jgi:thiol-disulfide isomerase/thioredoxin
MTHPFKRCFSVSVCVAAAWLAFGSSPGAQVPAKPKPTAQAVLDLALKTSKAANKGVFIHFSASWCTWCHKLEAFLESPVGVSTFGGYFVSEELIVQEVKGKEALENPGGNALLKKWSGADDTPLPYYVFLDSRGQKVADANAMPDGTSVGYPSTPDSMKAFDALLIKAAPKMPADTRAKILDYIATHK